MRSSQGNRPTTVNTPDLLAHSDERGDMYTHSQPEEATREGRLATGNSMVQGSEPKSDDGVDVKVWLPVA
jgi:hypothetical protein